jgi:hypothetical protein
LSFSLASPTITENESSFTSPRWMEEASTRAESDVDNQQKAPKHTQLPNDESMPNTVLFAAIDDN